MSAEAWMAIAAVVAVIVDLIVHLLGGTWLLARSRETLVTELTKKIDEQRARTDEQSNEARERVDREFANFRSEISETFKAIRQAITDVGKDVNRVELEAYKSFIRRDSFYEVMNRQQEVLATRMDDMGRKLDQVIRDPSAQRPGV